MKKNSAKQYAIALHQALSETKNEKDTDAILKNFVGLLSQRLALKSPEIIKEFIKYSNINEGIENIEIRTAHKLDKSIIELITKHFGKKTIITEKIDPELIGGVIIKTKDYIIDGSILRQINNLQKKII